MSFFFSCFEHGCFSTLFKRRLIHSKTAFELCVFRERGVYQVIAKAYDIRHYYEDTKEVTIFKMPCNIPVVWIPLSFTSLEKPELVPKKYLSEKIEYTGVSQLVCNESTIT